MKIICHCVAIATLALAGCSTPPAPPPAAEMRPATAAAAPRGALKRVLVKCRSCEKLIECSYTLPVFPRHLIQQGVHGVVRTKATVVQGRAASVDILDGPEPLHEVAREAMMTFECKPGLPERFFARQEFEFRIKDAPRQGPANAKDAKEELRAEEVQSTRGEGH